MTDLLIEKGKLVVGFIHAGTVRSIEVPLNGSYAYEESEGALIIKLMSHPSLPTRAVIKDYIYWYFLSD